MIKVILRLLQSFKFIVLQWSPRARIIIIWHSTRDARSQAPPQPYWILNSGAGEGAGRTAVTTLLFKLSSWSASRNWFSVLATNDEIKFVLTLMKECDLKNIIRPKFGYFCLLFCMNEWINESIPPSIHLSIHLSILSPFLHHSLKYEDKNESLQSRSLTSPSLESQQFNNYPLE